jgi:hypothetical protein
MKSPQFQTISPPIQTKSLQNKHKISTIYSPALPTWWGLFSMPFSGTFIFKDFSSFSGFAVFAVFWRISQVR